MLPWEHGGVCFVDDGGPVTKLEDTATSGGEAVDYFEQNHVRVAVMIDVDPGQCVNLDMWADNPPPTLPPRASSVLPEELVANTRRFAGEEIHCIIERWITDQTSDRT